MRFVGRLGIATRTILSSAEVWFAVLLIVGAALLTLGTYALAGQGWALVVSGALCMVVAALILKGMTHG
jgi:hypothetical protein